MPDRRSHVLVTAPVREPFTVEYVKKHVRIPAGMTDEDRLVSDWIVSARTRGEIETGRQFVTATWDLRLECFPGYEFELSYPPLQTVVSVTYRGVDGVQTVLDSTRYQFDAPGGPTAPAGRLRPAYGLYWPTTQPGAFDAVVIRIIAGYGDALDTDNVVISVPAPIRQAILIAIGDYAEGRQSPQRLTGGSATLADDVSWRLWAYRVRQTIAAA